MCITVVRHIVKLHFGIKVICNCSHLQPSETVVLVTVPFVLRHKRESVENVYMHLYPKHTCMLTSPMYLSC